MLEDLLCQPLYTLALGSALRSCGSVLRLLSYLVERRLGAARGSTNESAVEDGAFVVMLVSVLELAPHCGRCVAERLAAKQSPALALRRVTQARTTPPLTFTSIGWCSATWSDASLRTRWWGPVAAVAAVAAAAPVPRQRTCPSLPCGRCSSCPASNSSPHGAPGPS